jgi:multisubunit Na+/H+ antiporter MnhG subunit
MKDVFTESHRATAQTRAAVIFMALAAIDVIYGALSEKYLLFSVGAFFFTAGVLLFKLAKRGAA